MTLIYVLARGYLFGRQNAGTEVSLVVPVYGVVKLYRDLFRLFDPLKIPGVLQSSASVSINYKQHLRRTL